MFSITFLYHVWLLSNQTLCILNPDLLVIYLGTVCWCLDSQSDGNLGELLQLLPFFQLYPFWSTICTFERLVWLHRLMSQQYFPHQMLLFMYFPLFGSKRSFHLWEWVLIFVREKEWWKGREGKSGREGKEMEGKERKKGRINIIFS